MSVIEVEPLLTEISAEAPAGADVEYDPEYFELEKLAKGTPPTEIGDAKKEGEEPEWSEVKTAALKLFERTRDLRVAMILVAALLKEDGVAGFHDGIAVVKGLVEKLWDTLYPKLDPDDNNDPTIRVNVLRGFDGDGMAEDLYKIKLPREAILTNSPQKIGRFGYRDIQIANGEVPPPAAKEGEPAPQVADTKLIDAAFEDTATEYLVDEQTSLEESIATVKELDGLLNEKLAGAEGPNLKGLIDTLETLKGVLDTQLAKRGIGEAPAADGSEGGEASADGGGDAPQGGGGGGGAITGTINSRNDVIRMLDKICDYYDRYEPTSPVPVFMKRAKRLVTMNFVDLIKDLAPEAMTKIEVFTGEPPAEASG